ncbi:MAG: TRAP transporter substrate-binding protein [Gammaproteobacteria bacterium]|nr:TRAP transporter substrate-binding protein [Gammaproteobacteria bacterium]
MKKLFVATLTSGLLMGATSVASAAETLLMSSWLPPKHPIVASMIKPWIEAVETESKGELKIRILPKPLGAPPAHFDLAKDGVADLSYGVHGYQPGRFKLTAAVELPFLGDSAEATSVAYWRIYKKHFEQINEHEGAKLLGLMTHGPGVIHNAVRPITTVSDLAGLKIRIGGGVVADVAKSLGVTPIMASATKNYEMLSSGVADGTFLPMESIKSFKLSKLLNHATTLPGGLYNTSFFLVMNPAKFEGLSQANQDAMMRASGENFARIAGQGWDNADAAGRAAMDAAGIKTQKASAAMVKEVRDITKHVEANWIETANGLGVDGKAALYDLRSEIAAQSAK